MNEPDYGNAEPMNTARTSRNYGTTDNPNKEGKLAAVDAQVKKGQERGSQSSKDIQEQSKNDTLQRLKKMKEEREKKERKRGAGREDLMSKQRQQTLMQREEEKKRKAQGMGGSTVVG